MKVSISYGPSDIWMSMDHYACRCTFLQFREILLKVQIQEMGLINVLVLGVNWHIYGAHGAKVHLNPHPRVMTLGGALLA